MTGDQPVDLEFAGRVEALPPLGDLLAQKPVSADDLGRAAGVVEDEEMIAEAVIGVAVAA